MVKLKWPLREIIDLAYYRRPALFRRAKRLLYAGGALVALAWIGGAWAAGDRHLYESGAVSSVHAPLADDCGSCHASGWESLRRALGSGASVDRERNAACLRCHAPTIALDSMSETARHVHPRAASATAHADTFEACSTCHAEHEQAKLASVADAQCVSCHRDLRAIDPDADVEAGAGAIDHLGASGERGHPDFLEWTKARGDPGRLLFNHKVHLRAEGVADADNVMRVLACQDCHRAGATREPWPYAARDVAIDTVASRELDQFGARMQPIRHALHCAGCHTRSFETLGEAFRSIDAAFPEMISKDSRVAKLSVPHDTPAAIRAFLWGRLAESRAGSETPVRAGHAPKALSEVADEVATIEQWLYAPPPARGVKSTAVCQNCHVLSWPPAGAAAQSDGLTPPPPAGGHPPQSPPIVEPTKIPDRWLPRATFTHARHAGVACVTCHAAAVSSERTSDVLLPGIATCRQCHVSPPVAAGQPQTVASGCTLCHRFHAAPGTTEPQREPKR